MNDIQTFGAVQGECVVTTQALQNAIDSTAEAGGGTVYVPAGTWTCSTFYLRSNITLHLSPGAVLQASPDINDFPWQEAHASYPEHLRHDGKVRYFVVAHGLENVSICGGGTIDGNEEAYRPPVSERVPHKWYGCRQPRYRPLVELSECRNLTLENITLRDSAGWTCHVSCCDNVRIKGVNLFNDLFAGNSDGFDIDGSRDVMIADCNVSTGDDCIVLKTCRVGRSCERITITNCVLRSTCAAFKIGTETWHDVRNVTMSNCVVHGSSRAVQIFSMDGATIENVTVTNLTVDTNSSVPMNRPIHIDLCQRKYGGQIPGVDHTAVPVGKIRSIVISNISINTDGRIMVTAGDGGTLEQITLSNINMHMPWIEDPVEVKDDSDQMQSSMSVPEARLARSALVAANVDDFTLRDFSVTWPTGERLPADYQPKVEHGKVLRDPREQPDPQPGFHALWLKNVRQTAICCEGLTPSSPSIETIKMVD